MKMLIILVVAAVGLSLFADSQGCVYRRDKLGNKVECSAVKLCPSGDSEYCDKSGFCCFGCYWSSQGQAQTLASASNQWWRACLPDRGYCNPDEKCHYPYDDVNDKQLGICCWVPRQRDV